MHLKNYCQFRFPVKRGKKNHNSQMIGTQCKLQVLTTPNESITVTCCSQMVSRQQSVEIHILTILKQADKLYRRFLENRYLSTFSREK